MSSITEPLREEHRELWPHVEQLRETADLTGTMAPEELRRRLNAVNAFLSEHLLPHARAEEAVLYPAVARLMGAKGATATMTRDHQEVEGLVGELGRATSRIGGDSVEVADVRLLRRLLHGLYALLRVHFAKEEEIYLPLLDAKLTEAEATRMFEAMHAQATKGEAPAQS